MACPRRRRGLLIKGGRPALNVGAVSFYSQTYIIISYFSVHLISVRLRPCLRPSRPQAIYVFPPAPMRASETLYNKTTAHFSLYAFNGCYTFNET